MPETDSQLTSRGNNARRLLASTSSSAFFRSLRMRYFALVLFLLSALPAHAQICPDVQCPEGQVRDRTTCLCRSVVCALVCPPDQKLDNNVAVSRTERPRRSGRLVPWSASTPSGWMRPIAGASTDDP